MSTDESDDAPDQGPDEPESGTEASADPNAPPGEARKRKRRRRRRGGEAGGDPNAQRAGGDPQRGDRGPRGDAGAADAQPSGGSADLGPRADAGQDRERRQWQPRGAASGSSQGGAHGRLSEGAPGASVKVAASGGVDDGWDVGGAGAADPSERRTDAAGGDAGDGGVRTEGGATSAAGGEREGRRRRRRGRERGGEQRTDTQPGDGTAQPSADPQRGGGRDQRGGQPGDRDQRGGQPRGADQRGGDRQRGGGGQPGGGQQQRSGQPGGGQRGGGGPPQPRGGAREQRGRGRDQRGGDRQRSDDPRNAEIFEGESREAEQASEAAMAAAIAATPYEAPTTRLAQSPRKREADDLEDAAPEASGERWGSDDDGPPTDVVLGAGWPADAPPGDLDPVTFPLLAGGTVQLGEDVVSVVGVRFLIGGRIQWCDAADVNYATGDKLIVDSDRGPRLGTVAAPPARRSTRDRQLRRVIRRAHEGDLQGERDGDAERTKALRAAKDSAAQLRLPLKVYRVEFAGERGRGGKLNVYYTSDERLDLRDLVRDLGNVTGMRIELRQLGVRDEAKAVGGIGSCGLTLCCTTWLPDFVPVSIKMAKDQGLVLSPTKVAGQCGRLKCCLVYEQQGYAEMRKGLPKLGKRVISPRGEGRVVEVDVLRQRIRVSYGFGDTEVLPATEVKPLFPPGNQPPREKGEHARDADADDTDTDEAPAEDPRALPPPIDEALLHADDDDLGPTDDPSSDHYKPE